MKYPLPFCNTNNIINCPISVHTQVGWSLERAYTKREWSKLILLFRNNLPLGCHYQQNETSYYLNFFCTNFRILVHCASVDTYLCTQQPCMKFVWHSRSKEQLAVVQQQQRKQCHHHQPPEFFKRALWWWPRRTPVLHEAVYQLLQQYSTRHPPPSSSTTTNSSSTGVGASSLRRGSLYHHSSAAAASGLNYTVSQNISKSGTFLEYTYM